MKKMFNKAVLNGTTVMGDGLTYPRIPNVYTGDNEGGYQRGDMMDANAVVEMIKELTDTGKITIDELKNLINEEIQKRVEGDQDQQRYTDQKIKDLIGTSPETLDTLKEIADALGEDPDFAANVWNKIAELTTKHNEDVQELQDAITSGFENIDFTPYVKKTDVVTSTTNGLMLASDKTKLDAFEEADQYTKATNLPDSVISNVDTSLDFNGINLKYTKDNLIDGNSSEVILQIPIAKPNITHGLLSLGDAGKIASLPYKIIHDININQRDAQYVNINWSYNTLSGSSSGYGQRIEPATTSKAGVMSAADKTKLNSLINYQAGNGIDITGDTISCTLDTSLYSIVTELPETGLPNKIYLLPSTKTEEGNIYTEYGYVDNKWEELGKYKADVDLSPYERALNLPSDVVKALGVQSGANYVNVYSYKEDLDRGILSEVSEFDIPKATSENAGIITAQDKTKLDGIEAGAQVNTVESISVNGTPLEITDKGVDIPIHEYTAGDFIKLENGNTFSLMISKKTPTASQGLSDDQSQSWAVIPIVDFVGPSIDNPVKINGIYKGVELRHVTGNKDAGTPLALGLISLKDYNEFNAKQDALTEVQLNNINNAITSISVNDVEQINTNGTVNLTLPNASITEDGLMSASDKAKLDSQPTIKASDATGVTDDDYVVIKKSELDSILSRLSALENKA